ncbi:hypothetical protein CW304_09360 [Bacillus sp. UFRGS-B20]|nr:hypothetical protein CW304_09360 [Bacillus sp. UFRGS-B20]
MRLLFEASNPYSISPITSFLSYHLTATTLACVRLDFSTIFRTISPILNDVIGATNTSPHVNDP